MGGSAHLIHSVVTGSSFPSTAAIAACQGRHLISRSINIFSMAHSLNLNQFDLSQDFIDDAIVAQTNSVDVLCSGQFLNARRKRLVHQRLDSCNHPNHDAVRKLPQILLRGLLPFNATRHGV